MPRFGQLWSSWPLFFAVLCSSAGTAQGCVGEERPFPRCDPADRFGQPEPLSELATAVSREVDVVLAEDENVAYFSSLRAGGVLLPDGTRNGRDIYTARRKNRAEPFASLALVEAVSTADGEFRPLLTRDGLTLYFTRLLAGKFVLFRATRASGAVGFDAPTKVTIRSGSQDGGASGEHSPACPFLDPTGTLLYFTDFDVPGVRQNFLYVLGDSNPPSRIPELDGYQCIVISDDGTEAFVRKEDAKGGEQILRTDHSQGSSWSPPALVTELTASGESVRNEVTYLTRNHCDVYLSSTRNGAERLYWAHRKPL